MTVSATTATTAPATNPFAAVQPTSNAGAVSSANDAGSADRFLKLLVTQLQNQDPLNPTDNAQITSQMAQINTVSGIQQLNTTVAGLNAQFVQLQALQGASLVGHDVTVQGDRLAVAGGKGAGGFDLASTADSVKVDVLSPAGRVVDTLNLGSLSAGRHGFEWTAANAADNADYHFRVTAKTGTTAVGTTALMRDHVQAVSTQDNQLTLETQYSGNVAYKDVKAFN